ncbi:MAG: hypothetical protein INQ03_07620 [Candidatus Heimdallarchaeota archaeon]|nr:hypothetical protein [Candidatus Heimdallarchaeota archaeon]
MKYKIKAEINLEEPDLVEILLQAIEPENSTMPEGTVSSKIDGDKVVSIIEGTMSIGRLMNTIDDIVNTALLTKNLSDTT